jgi:site-specific recombinase XerC
MKTRSRRQRSCPARFDGAHAALTVLLGLNGLRVSEACSSNIEDLGFERGHRTLRILGKGGKPCHLPRGRRAGGSCSDLTRHNVVESA